MNHPVIIAIAAAVFGVLVFLDVLRANRSQPFIPRRGEGEEQRASDVHSELNGGRLPARVICDFHTGSNLTTEQSNHG